ncbi:MAG: discoidin domain-containing protein [Phycisphaerales bacterium]|nr:MAG: discoidin domain-containing protein [Phycisphaerales bacterium]
MSISLAGQWQFQLDQRNLAEQEKWFQKDLPHVIELPGSTAENGYGDDPAVDTKWTGQIVDKSWFTEPKYAPYRRAGSIKLPFWLTPAKNYVGPAWYRKDFVIPKAWADKRIVLLLERCHWETRVWVDAAYLGKKNSLSTPHEYDLGTLRPGKHSLSICVDNTVKIGVGVNAHSVSDHTQTNWNGIIGKIELLATDAVWIDDVQIYPDVRAKSAKVRLTVRNATNTQAKGMLVLDAASLAAARPHKVAEKRVEFSVEGPDRTVELDYRMGQDVRLWDEFTPNLYRLTASISGKGFSASKTTTFGMRQFGADGTQFTINSRRAFLRGTLECCIFPLTGYPPTDVESWLRILRIAKAHGLNHLRFHSWCPPEAAFAAADREGFYFHVECAAWTNAGPTIGDGRPIDEFIYAESDRILRAYGNHPSFCMLAYGNEPAGRNQKQYLAKLVDYWKSKDPRRVYTSGAGWPIIPENDYHSIPAPRGHQWGAGLGSRFNASELSTDVDYSDFVAQYAVPIVSHEIGQWCVYPNLDEIAKYTGVLKPANFEIFRDSLAQHHMLDQARDFLMASGKLQALLYKEEIEAALRTPGFGGFQLLDLHDFPGQGTALVGVLDPFWGQKGYIAPHEHHRFCCETVPLLRMKKCIWTKSETFTAGAEIAHFGPAPIQQAVPVWSVKYADGRNVAMGKFSDRNIPIGNGLQLGRIKLPLEQIDAPAKLVVDLAIEGTEYTNAWDIWVYPAHQDATAPQGIIVAESLDEPTLAALKAGKKVLLLIRPESIHGDIPAGFTTIFWNTQWTGGQPPHTLGIFCDPDHPALARFPTESHSNWQWWDLVSKSRSMILDHFRPEFRPIVQVIDDWNTNRRLGLIFEAKVNTGSLLVCSIDLLGNLNNRPVARQMLHSLFRYMSSPAFSPRQEVDRELLQTLLRKPSALESLGAEVINVDSQETDSTGRMAIDGNPQTFWHTAWRSQMPNYPHEIQIEFDRQVTIKGFRYLPRQDMRNGWIADYEFYVSRDGQNWGKPVAKGTFDNNPNLKTVALDSRGPVPAERRTGRLIRFVAISPIDPRHSFAAIAELDIILD